MSKAIERALTSVVAEVVVSFALAALAWYLVGLAGGPHWAQFVTAWLTYGINRIWLRTP